MFRNDDLSPMCLSRCMILLQIFSSTSREFRVTLSSPGPR